MEFRSLYNLPYTLRTRRWFFFIAHSLYRSRPLFLTINESRPAIGECKQQWGGINTRLYYCIRFRDIGLWKGQTEFVESEFAKSTWVWDQGYVENRSIFKGYNNISLNLKLLIKHYSVFAHCLFYTCYWENHIDHMVHRELYSWHWYPCCSCFQT